MAIPNSYIAAYPLKETKPSLLAEIKSVLGAFKT